MRDAEKGPAGKWFLNTLIARKVGEMVFVTLN